MVRTKVLIGVAALFVVSVGLLLGMSMISTGVLSIPFVDPHSIPFVDPHSIPFVDPHAITF